MLVLFYTSNKNNYRNIFPTIFIVIRIIQEKFFYKHIACGLEGCKVNDDLVIN